MSGGMKERGGEAVSEQVVRYLTGEMDQVER